MSRITLPLLVIVALILAGVIVGGCTGTAGAPAPGEIKKFGSVAEIHQYIENNTRIAIETEGEGGDYYTYSIAVPVAMGADVAVPPRAAAESAKRVSVSMPVVGAFDYSQTNVQVAGVDEPDFVKNEGRYIYLISGDTLTIVDAFPAATSSIVSKTTIEDSQRKIFISGNRLALFSTGTRSYGDGTGPAYAAQIRSMPPYLGSTSVTHIFFYDISDRAHPKITKEYTIDGDYIDARRIGRNLHLVTREQVYIYRDDFITAPCVRERGSCYPRCVLL